MSKLPEAKVQAVIKLLQNNVKRTDIVNIVGVSEPTIASIKKKAVARLGAPVGRTNNWKKNNVESKKKKDKSSNWFYDAIKERQAFDKSIAKEDGRGKQYPFEIVDDYCHVEPAVVKNKSKPQPYKLLVDKNNEVDVADEELSELEKILERLEKKGIIIGGIDYQGLRHHKQEEIAPYLDGDEGNVLVIGDIHLPHSVDGYLKFCREQQEKYNCGTIVFIGDAFDFHSISQWNKIPEELNTQGEIALARKQMKDRYHTFPKAYFTLGNHDLRPWRTAANAGLLREFIQDPHKIFEAPHTYEFVNEVILHNVLYTHGTKGTAFKKCITEGMNIVQGHCHNTAGVQFYRNRQGQVWGMQTGTGIDYEKVAFDYARELSAQPVLSCGVVLNNGTLPIVIPFIK